MKSIFISQRQEGQRFDRYLEKYLKYAGKSFIYKMLRKKNILLNGKKASGSEKLKSGDEIKIFFSDETLLKFTAGSDEGSDISASKGLIQKDLSEYDIDIIYEDNDILVVNKPVGVLSQKAKQGDYSLAEWADDYVKSQNDEINDIFRPGICNRLDRNTSGIVTIGKSIKGLQYLNNLFKERNIKKYYYCLVKGEVAGSGRLEDYLIKDHKKNKVKLYENKDEKYNEVHKIITEYESIRTGIYKNKTFTLLKVHLITGKTHQIRAHLKSMGHSIVGDFKYGGGDSPFNVKHQLLHAGELVLPDGRVFRADMPVEFRKCLEILK